MPVTTVAELPAPKGQPILVISGAIGKTNADGRAEFDRASLEQLDLVKLSTATPWTEGEREFEGVPLARLLEAVRATGSSAYAVAANDYAVDIPLISLRESKALLAMSMDGEQLRLRDKGPLWIIYPWSDDFALSRSETYSYAVWQLRSLRID